MADKNEKPAEKKATLAGSSLKISFGRAFNDTGSPIKEQYRWNKEHDGLVKVGEIDIQKKMDAEAKGMTPAEQIQRILRGDNTVIPSDPPLPPGDYSLAEEMTKEEILAQGIAPLNQATAAAQEKGMTLDEMEKELNKMLADVKAAQANKVEKKEEATDNG